MCNDISFDLIKVVDIMILIQSSIVNSSCRLILWNDYELFLDFIIIWKLLEKKLEWKLRERFRPTCGRGRLRGRGNQPWTPVNKKFDEKMRESLRDWSAVAEVLRGRGPVSRGRRCGQRA